VDAPIPTLRSFSLAEASRGTNQSGVKLYNERLVLSLIRRHRHLPKAEIARLTGLSMQTSSVITAQLERDGLLRREAPVRGKVGQPSTPLSLNPEGAFSLGFKLGRRSAEVVLMDLVGEIRASCRTTHAYPRPDSALAFLEASAAELLQSLSPLQRSRLRGVGVAAPLELWSWQAEIAAPEDAAQAWREVDLQAAVEARLAYPVHVCKDATAACAAELAFGREAIAGEALYIFVATLVGGGLVLNGNLYSGRTGYAGSLGSAPVPSPGGGFDRLIRRASLYRFAAMLREAGIDPDLLRERDDWSTAEPILGRWLDEAAGALAFAIAGALAVLDFQTVIVDGALPPRIRDDLVARIRARLADLETEGLAPARLVSGSLGREAPVRGAASLPLLAAFSRDTDVLFRATG
jgi:predicted NBD/HSP70 family sugar kinase